nr:unnamed protein product [Digitaria exilis]
MDRALERSRHRIGVDEQRMIAAAHRGLEEVKSRLGGGEVVTKQHSTAQARGGLRSRFCSRWMAARGFVSSRLRAPASLDCVVVDGELADGVFIDSSRSSLQSPSPPCCSARGRS